MARRINFGLRPITDQSLLKKFGVAFIFMSLVPIILILFIIYVLNLTPVLEEEIPQFRLTIILVVLLSVVSFYLLRKSIISLITFSRQTKEIVSGKLYNKRIKTKQRDELGILEESFNRMISELESKVIDLQKSKELIQNILLKIGDAFISSSGMDNLLELITESLAKGIEASSGAIFLLDKQTNQLVLRVFYGLEEKVKELRFGSDDGLLGRVIRLKKPEIVSNVGNNAAAYSEFKHKLAKDSIIAVPLIYKDKTLGAMIISDKEKETTFTKDDTILITNVAAQTAVAIENYLLNEDAEKTYIETITALAMAVEAKDPYSRGHIERVKYYMEKLGRQLKLDEEMIKVLKNGAMLHDVGKIGISDDILKKVGILTEEEKGEVKKHVIIGVNIIKPIRSMAALSDLIRYHQEYYDGSGYPEGVKGEEIPLTARMLKVCDAYDAMTTDRPYHKAMSLEEARQELIRKSGTEFDPQLIEEFLKII